MTSPAQAQDDSAATVDDQLGYFLGFTVGSSFAQQGFKPSDFTVEGMNQGLTDALSQKDPALSDEQLQEIQGKIQAMMEKRQAARMAEFQKQGVANKEKSELWMKQNAKAEGIKELEGGLQYKVVKEGEGASPSAEDTVAVHYTGKLTNGEVFDSSVQRGQPAKFPVNRVIQGWQMALQQMKVGSKWMLYIPPELAYGENGSPPKIGPNEVLVFEVELLEIL
ncbi:FKBP-type peptidyl-prolyl cis-trans isomerase [Rhodopirellula halodulae]|uniref:FKBP-type peptidyl-prolyl cis-trans isomerase n=1 Tax=Rhodopirellula halodulae TaxID=2894198 RepID=UPI001E44110E|nr:FKBP-type peptidyl-prolyl cis-trans isomerase [Rhodopirellula sp. JC737]MCC9654757.1 FKBP-type peptidyl-prolyl cis-trans isomerase [Rhodopirellula sp. JC737]